MTNEAIRVELTALRMYIVGHVSGEGVEGASSRIAALEAEQTRRARSAERSRWADVEARARWAREAAASRGWRGA